MNGILGRSLLAVALCLATAGTLWALPSVEPAATTSAPPHVSAFDLAAPLPQVGPLQFGEPRLQAPAAPAPETTPAEPQPDPLAEWAASTAPLLGVPELALIGYGTADLVMQDREPGCRLSWITLAALGRVGSDEVHPEAGVPDAIDTAEKLCAGGRDTTTENGWESAVRAVGEGTAHVHQVLAAATTYATAVRSGVPINPAAQAAINFAIDQIGLPYVWGGNGPELGDSGFDCSGLIKAAYATAGIELPRTAHSQYFATRRVPNGAELQPGDLLFYGNPATQIHHVGLYIGNGQMINAPTFGMPVQVADYRSAGSDFAGAGRVY